MCPKCEGSDVASSAKSQGSINTKTVVMPVGTAAPATYPNVRPPDPTTEQLKEMMKMISELKSEITSLKRPPLSDNVSNKILTCDPVCHFCSLNVREHRYCPLSGLPHVSSHVCDFRIKETMKKFPFPDEIIKDTANRIADVLFFYTFYDILEAPSELKEDAFQWLTATYEARVTQVNGAEQRETSSTVPLENLASYVPKSKMRRIWK